jgi:hypothetical protein
MKSQGGEMQKTVDLTTAAFREMEALEHYSAEALQRAGCVVENALRQNPHATDDIHDQFKRYLLTMQRIVNTANAQIMSIIKERL